MLDWKRFLRWVSSSSIVFLLAGGPAFAQASPKDAAPKDVKAKVAPKPAAKPRVPNDDAKAGGEPALAAPVNDSGEAGDYWIIDFEEKALRMIAPTEGLGSGQVYWYMVYTLANKTKGDHDIYVKITATSDHGKQYADLYLPSVEKAIERKENLPLWGKTDELALLAKRKPSDPKYQYVTIKAGEKRSCVAVFNRLDPNANKITLRVEGLSNEVKEVVKEDGTRFLESRVRELYFERPGDEHAITMDTIALTGQDWVKKKVAAAPVSGQGGPSKDAAPSTSGAAGVAPEGNGKEEQGSGSSDGK